MVDEVFKISVIRASGVQPSALSPLRPLWIKEKRPLLQRRGVLRAQRSIGDDDSATVAALLASSLGA